VNKQENNIQLFDVEQTGLLTLYCKAIESGSDDPIMVDKKAIEAANILDPILARSQSKMLRQLVSRKIDQRAVVHIALRAQKYDAYASNYLMRNPGAVLVNLGCGMDTRFFRIDNGSLRFFDVDLPAMIAFKKKVFDENERYQMIPKSIFDYGWMDMVEKARIKRIMFQAEGVFMYLDPKKVRQLVLDLRERFPGSELVCEVVRKQWTRGIWEKMASMKMTRRLNMGKQAGFNFGMDYPKEMQAWHPGIQFLDQWSYFESDHKKLGYMRIFGKFRYFKETQYTVHYKFN
jgi:methyltransferase (TIGR00027 family)